ncbi:MAG: hypothetical protein A3C27_01055 [Candidatus Levybacteria bacterium RIFCSPHIGHO2_02_FULL_39_36]|nr:MAG: Glutamate-tRNA ligase [Candidatus Levybacteria bacterium GW2011_GWA1_39_11]KKR25093.1 MAG: Glutamate-tRNA ligase [Candidatus Levybacteria bacterium GW2011_GWB1_39_7]KKR26243.1 MAG: Glutamate-tRNA ligase [Microgenomates group bacterium GW2011_GWC1_39_7]OGH15535.1 MAG: hypothetical protein A2689_03075 [Candidatus Levybacteria bacterium RIFCSPHIGHO2_01_FULL_38_96]OGH25445.1 MAG: hypothetical protein A3E68_01050 [Candidatus Levybacteria bacterium RIFCSPHIGHO2_12_FULL_39_39]OGH28402.1 MAG: 
MHSFKNVRVRIAPSPTGIPHVGNTRTALFNFLFARHNNGEFILRLEDTDQKRIAPGSKEAIFEILSWLGIEPDKIYTQSERLDLYKQAAKNLLERKLAKEDEGAIRFIIPKGKTLAWKDAIGNKTIVFKSDVIEDFIILKSDGFPTYHLASVVDDHAMNISHVIRGDEWISSTPKHLLLYQAFNWEPPVFAHLPVILGPDKTKLSKRHGAKSVLEYRDQGYLREALSNFMALLGWNPGENQEIMNLQTMIDLFDLKDVNTGSPIFDIKKLDWINGIYIRSFSQEELIQKLKEYADRTNLKIPETGALPKLIELAQPRMSTFQDFFVLIEPVFSFKKEVLNREEVDLAKITIGKLQELKSWTKDSILIALRKLMEKHKVKMPFFYVLITGRREGLPLPEIIEILGKDETLRRLKEAI